MAFTGYVFNSLDEIMPFLEDKDSGPSVQWAKKQGKVRLQWWYEQGGGMNIRY